MVRTTSRVLIALAALAVMVAVAAVVPVLLRSTAPSDSSEQNASPQAAEATSTPGPYFPEGFGDHWYARNLAAMNERPLWPPRGQVDGSGNEVYRFLWLRSFHRPVSVRLEKTDGNARAVLKLGEVPLMPAAASIQNLSAAEWSEFIRLVEDSSFWQLPTEEGLMDMGSGVMIPVQGLDGARWVMEGRKGGKYHLVDRWSPDFEAGRRDCVKYRELCLLALRLAGVDLEKEKVH